MAQLVTDPTIHQWIGTHKPCGYPLRVFVRFSGAHISNGHSMYDVLVSWEHEDTLYYTYDAEERRVTHCPRCGEKLPVLREEPHE